METNNRLPHRYAIIIDPVTIRAVLDKISRMDLPRRECRPLDRYTDRKTGLDLARYDAQIDADPDMDMDELDDICDTMDAMGSHAADSAEAAGGHDEDGHDDDGFGDDFGDDDEF
jgi:hypothetical protein